MVRMQNRKLVSRRPRVPARKLSLDQSITAQDFRVGGRSSGIAGGPTQMDIWKATKSYEDWMRSCTTLVESHLRYKHAQMRLDPFLFLRGTYYRWAQLWPVECSELSRAPKVLAVGDLHVGSFGTWRDAEGRMAWGVDDFDESYPLAYTNDLVRLAASMKIAIKSSALELKFKIGCDAILEGYESTLRNKGFPIVLAEREGNLDKLGIAAIESPEDFWEKLSSRPAIKSVPSDAKKALLRSLPDHAADFKIVRREAGVGSLGQQRFVVVANCQGGYVAREAKAMVPSATAWLHGKVSHCQSYYQKAITNSIRSHDPYQQIVGRWLIRRLSPEANPIEIEDLPKEHDAETLLHAMGTDAANVHLGTVGQTMRILKDLKHRKSSWLRLAAKSMARTVEEEWKEYRKG
jgi:hypothetical protein